MAPNSGFTEFNKFLTWDVIVLDVELVKQLVGVHRSKATAGVHYRESQRDGCASGNDGLIIRPIDVHNQSDVPVLSSLQRTQMGHP